MKKLFISVFLLFIFVSHAASNEIMTKISNNWNQIKSMSGDFQQTDTDGNISHGKFYFLKPHHSKFEYINKPENIVTNQRLIRIIDNDGYQIDSYPIGNNIIKKILSEEVQLSEDFDIRDIKLEDKFYELSLFLDQETSAGRATFYFDKNNLDLKKWEILDEFENKTVLEFTKIKKNIFISKNLFVVKYK